MYGEHVWDMLKGNLVRKYFSLNCKILYYFFKYEVLIFVFLFHALFEDFFPEHYISVLLNLICSLDAYSNIDSGNI